MDEIVVQQEAFVRALQRAAALADTKNSMPVIACVRLSYAQSELVLQATDLYVSSTVRISAQITVTGSPRGCCVPARTALDLVRGIGAGDVRLRPTPETLGILAGGGKFRLRSLEFDAFPKVPETPFAEKGWRDVKGVQLTALIAATQYCVGQDPARAHLNGALLEQKGNVLSLTTSDGHRLAHAEVIIEEPGEPFAAMLSERGLEQVAALCALAGEDIVSFNVPQATRGNKQSAGVAFFRAGNEELSLRLVEDIFVNYTQVVSRTAQEAEQICQFEVDRAVLISALERVAVVAATRGSGIKLSPNVLFGGLHIVGESAELGDGEEDVAAEVTGGPKSAREGDVCLSVGYLLEALRAAGKSEERVRLTFAPGGLYSVQVRRASADGFLAVIMPMRY